MKRALLRLLVLAAAGMTANAIVTLVLATTLNPNKPSDSYSIDLNEESMASAWSIHVDERLGTWLVMDSRNERSYAALGVDPDRLPWWYPVELPGRSDNLDLISRTFLVEVRGLPAPCMWARVGLFREYVTGWGAGSEVVGHAGAVVTPLSGWSGRTKHPRLIPLRPIWRGWLINVAFYACIIGIIWYVVRSLMQLRRLRRGQCLNCKYNMRGDFRRPCPECGWQMQDAFASA